MLTVQIIRDSDLPEPHDWALVQFDDQHTRLFVKRSAFGSDALADGYAAFRKLHQRSPLGAYWEQPAAARVVTAVGAAAAVSAQLLSALG